MSRDLPLALGQRQVDVTLVTPAYRGVFEAGQPIQETGITFDIPIGSKQVQGSLLRTTLPGSNVPVLLIRNENYYDRAELYQKQGEDYKDNCERFVFFCKAVMQLPGLLSKRFDILHCNDWQTGLLPAYLKTEFAGVPDWENAASVFTIHNLAYQGVFWHWDMLLTGMDWKYFNWQQMEFFGNLNLMKTALSFADYITTVSPRYAQEIQTAQFGCGLESVLQYRSEQLVGILNGVNYDEWDPATDANLPAKYSASDLSGKAQCKVLLQQEFGLPQEPGIPLIGLVGRLSEQKGIELAASAAGHFATTKQAQFVLLGTGDTRYENELVRLKEEFPQYIGVRLEFSNRLAHLLEAGSDMFLMPSRYEPCGLNQMYSLRYGTPPIVHATGGLADTVTDATSETLQAGTANGFAFTQFSQQACNEAIGRAFEAYQQPEMWQGIVRNGMNQDWSWNSSATSYEALYRRALAAKRNGVTTV